MRFHKAQLAFFILVSLLVCGTGILAAWLYRTDLLQPGHPATTALVVHGATIVFGLGYFYPVLHQLVREEMQLRAMTQSLSKRSENLQHAALTDGLTGMQNRRYFDDALAQYLEEFKRINRPVGLMILDLDHFKSVNDTHGHDAGDEVLRAVADCLREFTRYHDVVARLGGEEFAIVAPNMDADTLTKFANRIRMAVSQITISSGNIRIRVTVSVGLAIWDGREGSDDLFRRADAMLYKAKRDGRNRVCAAA